MKRPFTLLMILLLSVPAVQAQMSFAPLDSLYYTSAGRMGNYTIANTYPADFNNDGLDDVIYLNGHSLYIRMNTGNNSFEEETLLYTDEEHIYSISNFTDINNDTYPDVAIATNKATKILYASDGAYVKGHERTDIVYFGKLILLDNNKDGKPDLASSQMHSILIYNDVNMGLQDKSTLYTDEGIIHHFAIQDLNADDADDLVISIYQDKLEVLFGSTNNTFRNILSRPLDNLAFFEMADLNLDGFQDITFLEWNSNLFTLIYDSPSETFREQAVFPEDSKPENLFNFHLVDLKNNGTIDLVYNNFLSLAIRENNGLGQFLDEKILLENNDSPYSYHAFNLDADEFVDIIFGDYNKFQIVSFKSDGTVNNSLGLGYHPDFRDAIYHDIDQDGFKDIISISTTGSFQIRWGNSGHTYTEVTKHDIPLDAYYGAVADVNGDGHEDLLITQESGSNGINDILLVSGKGDRGFDPPVKWKYFPNPAKPLIHDIDNDGKSDLLIYGRLSKEIAWLDFGNTEYNDYFFTSRKLQISGEGIRSMICHDINKDGYADLFTANVLSKDVSMLINDQAGNFTETLLTPEGTVMEVNGVQAFDYNEDDHDDLLVLVQGEANSYSMQVFLNDQANGFVYDTTHVLSNMYLADRIHIMDIDSDEDLDLIISAWDYASTNVFIREHGTMINKGSEVITSCGQSARLYEDLNDDTKPDVFTATFHAGSMFVQLNNSVTAPPVSETTIAIEEIKTNSVRFSLSETSASGRLVIITKGKALLEKPADNYFYSANSQFSIGSKLAANAYVVHAGSGQSVEITGLGSSTEYLISVFEYNVNLPQVTIINYADQKIELPFTTINSPPQIADIPDQTGSNLQTVSLILEITDPDNLMDQFDYRFSSSNPEVVPEENIGVVTTGNQPVLEITPIDYGASTIEVTVTDTARNSSVVRIHYSSVVVGIEEMEHSPFAVYPNPFKSTVSVAHSERNHVLMVYNVRGELIKQFNFLPETIDLSAYPAGFYFFKTRNGDHYKVLKE